MLGDELQCGRREREAQLQGVWISRSREGRTLCAAGLKVTFCQARRLPDREWAETLRWTTVVPSCLLSAFAVAIAAVLLLMLLLLLLLLLLSWSLPLKACRSRGTEVLVYI